MQKTLRTCPRGHQFYKSSDCPVCPICEEENKPGYGFLSLLSAPARRALMNAGISKPEHLVQWSEKELLQLHGFGPASIPILKKVLKENGLALK